MRRNTRKNFNSPPTSLANARSEQEIIARTGDLDRIDPKIYKGHKARIIDTSDLYFDQEEYEVRYKLRRLYHNKCAYCEKIEYKPDVEHYRPKKEVIGSQGNRHGYYWLCYEWTNLLPSCPDCNRVSGKGKKFPINGPRVISPPFNTNGTLNLAACRANHAYHINENPCLLHPEIDHPENFLGIKRNGKLYSFDGSSGIGQNTIDTCDLNRGNLIYQRKLIIDNFVQKIHSTFLKFRRDGIPSGLLDEVLMEHLEWLKLKAKPNQEYSLVAYYILNHFPAFTSNHLAKLHPLESRLLIKLFQQLP